MVQLLLLPLHHSCFIQNGLLFWNQLTQVLLEKEAIIKWVFVLQFIGDNMYFG